jgi:hypothetical protein
VEHGRLKRAVLDTFLKLHGTLGPLHQCCTGAMTVPPLGSHGLVGEACKPENIAHATFSFHYKKET